MQTFVGEESLRDELRASTQEASPVADTNHHGRTGETQDMLHIERRMQQNKCLPFLRCISGEGTAHALGSSGAGHGGNGGSGRGASHVGTAYGHLYEPEHFGCQGGGGGGLGGGVIKMNVRGTLQVDGSLHCDGQTGAARESGGGSGGSVWITANLIRGYGTISVNGGRGYFDTRYGERGNTDRALTFSQIILVTF